MPELYSHSRLSNFETCPRKFQYRYVLKVPAESEGIEGFMGKRVHEVLERLYLAVGRDHVPSLPQVVNRFRILWDEHYDEGTIRIVRSENPPDYYRTLGERCLANYYHRHYPFDGDRTLGIEKRVTFPLDDAGRYRVQGIVDRIVRARDGTIEIHDYKTGRRVPSQGDLDADRQLALYQIGVAREYAAEQPFRLVWHYVQRDRLCTSTRTPDQLEGLVRETTSLIDRIRAEREFEPKPGPLCGWCEYNGICPAAPGNRDRSPATSSEPAGGASTGDPHPSPSPSGTTTGQLTLL